MKRINKGEEPQRLREWKQNNAQFSDANYDSHQFPVAEVNSALVAEQFGICAYTMIRITEATSHNEHLKPRSISKNETPPKYAETTDFRNLVACYPNTGVFGKKCSYGADARENKWDPALFITPLNANCEKRFTFLLNGTIKPANPNDKAAKWTIETLVLDHKDLDELRNSAILKEGLSPLANKPLTASQARSLADVVCEPDGSKQLKPFCVAIKHAALLYIQLLEKKQRQRVYARSSKAKGKKK